MFNPNRTLIDAFVDHTLMGYRETFPAHDQDHDQLLEQAARAALETLLNCDCPYHDIHHTKPFDKYYCITTGWLNPLLYSIGFFPRTEALLRWVFRNPKTPASQGEVGNS